MSTKKHAPIVQELIDLIAKNKWEDKFNQALKKAQSYNIAEMADIKTMEDYYNWLEAQLTWIPNENPEGKIVYEHVCKFYFLLDQSPVKELQNSVVPHDKMEQLTPLSAWMVRFVREFGAFMDTPESLTPESEKTFWDSPIYNMDEYERPRGGWKTYNQLFGRHVKPGMRPIAAINDASVIVAPADSTFDGQWEVRADSHVDIKGLDWRIEELLEGSPYKDRFKGGIWCHSFLNTFDYHREHAPVGGRVLEARVIPGTVYLEVNPEEIPEAPGTHKIGMKRVFDAPDNPGYEFMHTRGLVVIESEIGLVAVLPMGMAQVSSIVVTCQEGQTLQKGDEISYFQFGGSDIVMVFERASNVCITAQPGVHYRVGAAVAKAYPMNK
ncbi:MAG: phosphatidylserine decarboxylase [Bacteroidales bacterium]